MTAKHVTAIDLGASSGRLMDVAFDGNNIQIEEFHRFPNIPVFVQNTLYWDVLRIWHEITEGLQKRPSSTASIGVDTWGVDFALLDAKGHLLANPVHYRDRNRDGVMDWTFERVPKRDIFERTGLQFMQLNGLYQLAAMLRDGSPLLHHAQTLLMMPDLFNYWLSGTKACEFTIATTSQMYNPRLGDWDREMLAQIGIPTHFFTDVVPTGTKLGEYDGTTVIAPATHDTGSAIVAIPTTTPDFAYISSGTWSLLGLERNEAIINDAAYDANVTNEGGFGNSYRFLKNIMGLWLVEQSLETWRKDGHTYDYEACHHMVNEVENPFAAMVDPDAVLFLSPGDIPARIREYCTETGQTPPQSHAQVLATIHVSLAMKYRSVLDQLERVAGTRVERLHIIGGGSNNRQLNQMTANAIGRPVYTGPTEATALGNGIVQLISLGTLNGIDEARTMLASALDITEYAPQETERWQQNYERFLEIIQQYTETLV